MKKFIVSFILVSFSTIVLAQDDNTKAADYLFKKYEFTRAAEQYLKLAQSAKANQYTYKQLADCYYYTSKFNDAQTWYAKALETSSDKESLFRYAETLKLNGKLAESNVQMDKFKSLYPTDLRAKAFSNKVAISDKPKYTIKKLDINSPNSEFGAFLNNNTLYFASSRNLKNKKYSWNNEPFLDIYQATLSDNNTLAVPTEVKEVNSEYNDGPATVTADGKTMYFSTESFRNNSYEKDSKDKLKLSRNCIYRATNTNGKWTNIENLTINSSEYSMSNPCISRDGKTLYFSSNRTGGLGGIDVWKMSVNSDGSFGTAENLGDKVNTEANESFPFIADDNTTLYFSSNGKNGFGAYDIYSINLSKNENAQNLGKPINTTFDDFSFSYYDAKKTGFFSSNRDGNDDIFGVEEIKKCVKNINTIVKNEKTGELLANASVTILDENKTVVSQKSTNEKGELNFDLECNKAYFLTVAKQNFESKTETIASDEVPQKKIEIALKPSDVIITDKEVLLNPIYFELNKWDITPQGAKELDKLVTVMNDYPDMIIFAKSHTDNRGSDQANLILSDKRAKSTVAYVISKGINANRISGKGFGETEPKVICDKCTEEQHSQNRRSEFLLVKK